jgi:hypothetical protein
MSEAEAALGRLLESMRVPFRPQLKWAGHRVDFTVFPPTIDPLLVDVNGDHWHSWSKIVECDRVKLNRVFGAGHVVLGVWWSRLQQDRGSVRDAIWLAAVERRLAWWDWKVPIGRLDVDVQTRVRTLLDWQKEET